MALSESYRVGRLSLSGSDRPGKLISGSTTTLPILNSFAAMTGTEFATPFTTVKLYQPAVPSLSVMTRAVPDPIVEKPHPRSISILSTPIIIG